MIFGVIRGTVTSSVFTVGIWRVFCSQIAQQSKYASHFVRHGQNLSSLPAKPPWVSLQPPSPNFLLTVFLSTSTSSRLFGWCSCYLSFPAVCCLDNDSDVWVDLVVEPLPVRRFGLAVTSTGGGGSIGAVSWWGGCRTSRRRLCSGSVFKVLNLSVDGHRHRRRLQYLTVL